MIGTRLPGPGGSDLSPEFLDFVTDIQPSSDLTSVLLVASSLAFLVPGFGALRLGKFWFAWLYCGLAITSACSHACATGSSSNRQGPAMCSANMSKALAVATQVWACFSFLQTAFLLLGPEDPQLQNLGEHRVNDAESCDSTNGPNMQRRVPREVIVITRGLPLAVLTVFHSAPFFTVEEPVQLSSFMSALITELLMVCCLGFFWSNSLRRDEAAEVLLRLKYWHRLMHHGIIPSMLLCWLSCIMVFTSSKGVHFMWHIALAGFAVSILRTVIQDDSSDEEFDTKALSDTSAQNPIVSHLLLGAVAITVIPTACVRASFNWCNEDRWHRATPDGYEICLPISDITTLASVPIFAAIAAIFWLIRTTSLCSNLWMQLAVGAAGISKRRDVEGPPEMRQRALGLRLGCSLGALGSLFGLLAVLAMTVPWQQDIIGLLFGTLSTVMLVVAMVLTVLSSDPSGKGYGLRHAFTFYICIPLMAIYGFFGFLLHCGSPAMAPPTALVTSTEVFTAAVLCVWPMAWAFEVREQGLGKSAGNFAWPVTQWRFE